MHRVLTQAGGTATISGRLLTLSGQPVKNAPVTIQGGGLPQPIFQVTAPFGYYVFGNLQVGQTYTILGRCKAIYLHAKQ